MTLTLEPPNDLETRLRDQARRQGQEPEEYTLALLDRQLLADEAARRERAIALLRSWREEGDEAEQRETWEGLRRALDEDRPSYRKLFPPELKGISW